jgi:hypothetical protein
MVQRDSPKETRPESESEKERKENAEYLKRLRALIEEDRKSNANRKQINGVEIERTANLATQSILPLTGTPLPNLYPEKSSDEITLKIVCETRETVTHLKSETTLAELVAHIKATFAVKRFKIYSPTRGEIKPDNPSSTLSSEGISNMDVIRVFKV